MQPAEINIRCSRTSRIDMLLPNFVAFIVFKISAIICIYFIGSETLPSICYIPFDESCIAFNFTKIGYKNIKV